MPLELRLGEGTPVRAQALVDSGATVNVMPYRLGFELGAKWDKQTTTVKLTGNLADQEARALLVEALISGIEPVRLVFAWSQSEGTPLLLGQVNFFQEFDVCFRCLAGYFEIDRAST